MEENFNNEPNMNAAPNPENTANAAPEPGNVGATPYPPNMNGNPAGNQFDNAGGAQYGSPNNQFNNNVDSELATIPPNPSGAALALGIIGLVMAVVGGPFFGVIGGGIGLGLGIAALCLGISAKNKTDRKKGKGGFVLGIITICFGVIMTFTFLLSGLSIRAIARNKGLPLLEKHGTAMTFGVVGLVISVGNKAELKDLLREIKSIANDRAYEKMWDEIDDEVDEWDE